MDHGTPARAPAPAERQHSLREPRPRPQRRGTPLLDEALSLVRGTPPPPEVAAGAQTAVLMAAVRAAPLLSKQHRRHPHEDRCEKPS